jgi:hypothetical protein
LESSGQPSVVIRAWWRKPGGSRQSPTSAASRFHPRGGAQDVPVVFVLWALADDMLTRLYRFSAGAINALGWDKSAVVLA